jgi:hypothetical protein
MHWLFYVALALGAGFLIRLWSPRRMPTGTGVADEIQHQCGAPPLDRRYPGATNLGIRIVQQCNQQNKVIIKTKQGNPPQWKRLHVNNTPLLLDQGGCYIVPGEVFQLECPGEGEGCKVVVLTMDHNQRPDTDKLLSNPPQHSVARECDSWNATDDLLLNLTTHKFTIEVKWLESCSETAPVVRFRRLDRPATAQDLYRPNSAGATATKNGNVYEWVGAIEHNESLEVKCPGGSGKSCKFTIVWQGVV